MSKVLVHIIPAIPFAISTVIAAGIANWASQPRPDDELIGMAVAPVSSTAVADRRAFAEFSGLVDAADTSCREITGHFTARLQAGQPGSAERRVYTFVTECSSAADIARRVSLVTPLH